MLHIWKPFHPFEIRLFASTLAAARFIRPCAVKSRLIQIFRKFVATMPHARYADG